MVREAQGWQLEAAIQKHARTAEKELEHELGPGGRQTE
jgi:hypothetical protein